MTFTIEQIPWPLWTAFVAAIVAAWYALMKVLRW
jgi:hypothetical protein